MIEWLSDPQLWISLLTLAALEIVLGIDNLVFLAILADRLPEAQRPLARKLGLAFALVTRLALLASLAWIVGLVDPVFTVWDHPVSWRDIILIGGGLFLLTRPPTKSTGRWKARKRARPGWPRSPPPASSPPSSRSASSTSSSRSIGHHRRRHGRPVGSDGGGGGHRSDRHAGGGGPLSAFVSAHPTVKMLALAFLLLVGMALVADGLGFHIPKGYLYFVMGFSVMVEALNLIARRKRRPVKLRSSL